MLWLWTFVSGAVTLGIFAWITFRIYYRNVLRICRAIPSAQPCLPLIGNILLFVGSQAKVTDNLLRVLEDSVLNGQRAVCFWLCSYPLVFITDPDDIKKILNNSLSRGKEFEESGKGVIKYGLLTSPVDHWNVARRQLNFSFKLRNLQHLIPTFNKTSKQLVYDLSEHLNGTTLNIYPYLISAALRAITIFLYGTGALEHISNEQFEENKRVVELLPEIMAQRMFQPWLRNDVIFKLFFRKELKFCKSALQAGLNILKKVSVTSTLTREHESTTASGKTPHGFQTILNAMRELQENDSSIKEQHVMDEMNSFFGTGTDTIAASVSSCLLALARLPDVQEKVYEEICSVVTEDDVDYNDLQNLTYLDQVVKETLRFFPVAPFITRAPTSDIDLGGYTIPKNNTTSLYISSVNFNPKYFSNPHVFDPDRFSSSNRSDNGVFAPFGRGARTCIGKEYSMMLIKVMVVHVVRKYKLSTSMDIQNLKKKFILSLICCDGYNVSLTERGK